MVNKSNISEKSVTLPEAFYVCINSVVKTLTRKGFNKIIQAIVYLVLQWYRLFVVIVFIANMLLHLMI